MSNEKMDNLVSLIPEKAAVLEEMDKRKLNKFGERKIQPEWIPDILIMAAQPDSTYVSVAKKVKDKWGVSITPTGIRAVIKQAKVDRSEISKTVVRDNIGGYILGDLEILKTKKQELVELSVQFKAEKDWKNYYGAIDRIKEYSKMLFELSGVNEKQAESDAEIAKQELMDMFEKFQHSKE